MKTFAYTLLLASSLVVGACAGGNVTAAQVRTPSAASASSGSSGGAARREIVASSSESDREPGMMFRAERGIPTPQPARDPSFMASPTPQPPIPSPDVHRSSHSVSREAP
jgi:hypothetical protein